MASCDLSAPVNDGYSSTRPGHLIRLLDVTIQDPAALCVT